MKRLIFLLVFLILVCVACDASDPSKCKESVVREFPNFEVTDIPGDSYSFLVKDKNGNLWFVKTLSLFSPNISSIRRIDGFNCKD
jgi:hypothetical protein